ncbi:hypothetical protein G7085_00790 [Tessaracoccus sp. HDW20]|uniref:hypothetical protein n=1 Tax=Tessaracoccus coleopterorum TaxID=2714950 RepID=UPI0018D3C306|nr:hypothetical protein [Tessaracoccus coleopterorum]NHB83730.1 hypothetical protein [Tessaracoccus coleopterorum]
MALGSWAAAFTVLVLGVAQVVTGSARAYWQGRDAQPGGWWEFLVWNLGGLTVIAGTLLGSVATVAIGSALLVAGLVLALLATLHPTSGVRGGSWSRTASCWLCWPSAHASASRSRW